MELKDIEKRMHQLTKKQSTLLDLLNDNELTRDEWKVQNEVIRNGLVHLTTRRQQLQSYARKEKDIESPLHVFEKQVSQIIHLNIKDEKILKQFIHKLIHKIEVFDSNSIKIHFNFLNPSTEMGA
ncbi:hypothetical protein PAEAM_02450 [Paenibacillus sp. GM1FR]|uniref:hypothetical protein n=1 Tax=Paenibacillus sp. GM1FR TaxID=2059267 RepID=UPI000CA6C29E|nr:hypothetical protein [Paenibacillus sp. GM1FR]PJN65893.1 hypothetical protein PAEAM_02450 [Paenibacillus sp. GM1FR]